jgi:DNA-nicking Smr family endonuclease
MVQKDFNEGIEYPIDGVLDLHTFHPSETHSLVNDYLNECFRAGIKEVRIIHGKGKSVQKSIVHSVLKKNPLVSSFSDASPEAGHWGATIVTLF